MGIRDNKKLQLDAKLTLESAIAEVRQSELVKKQQAIVRGDSAVDGVKSNRRPRGVPRSKCKPAGTLPKPRTCTRCGKSPPHGKPQCLAREATCHACHKKGHYRHCCKTKESIKQVVVQDDSSDEAFLETIGVNGVATNTPWSVKLLLNKRTQEFKVDTGADVTVIRQAAYKRENNGELVPSNLPSNGPTGEMLNVSGKFTGSLTWKGLDSQQDIYVIRHLRRALLGKPALEALNIVALVEPIQEPDIYDVSLRCSKVWGG